MFDYNKEVIINSATLEDGTPSFAVKTEEWGDKQVEKLYVYRNGEYFKSKITNLTHKVGTKGTAATIKVTVPAEEGTYRFVLALSLDNKYMADYANPWSEFNKTIVVEFEGGAEALAKAFKAALPTNYKIVKSVSAAGDVVTIELAESYQVVNEGATTLSVLTGADRISEDYVDIDGQVEVTKNVTEVITGKWLRENLRFPTYSNMRYEGLNADEAPIQNEVYTMFSFQYAMPLAGLHGQGCVGQAMASVTTHTFYVLGDMDTEGTVAKAFAASLGL